VLGQFVLINLGLYFSLSLFFVKSVFAYSFFDDFRLQNSTWSFLPEAIDRTVPQFTQDGLVMQSNLYYFPFIYNQDVILPTNTDYVAKFKFKYTRVTSAGSGFGLGFIKSNGFYLPQSVVWQDTSNYLHFFHQDFSEQRGCADMDIYVNSLSYRTYKFFDLNNENTDWHIVEIERVGNQFKMYLDRELNPDPFIITNPINNQCQPNIVFFGNPTSSGFWTNFIIDYFKIDLINQSTPTPTLSPTPIPSAVPSNTPAPTPTVAPTFVPSPTLVPTVIPTPPVVNARPKVVIIPGFGASWNTEAIVYNLPVSSDSWKMTPFVHEYDGLVKTLENMGYVKNVDLFVWNYDWRKRVQNNVGLLNSFINTNVAPGEKLVLVGHSMGGLISRGWLVENSSDSRLLKVFTLGSPHYGMANAYSVWAGGDLGDKIELSPESLGEQLLLSVWKKQYGTEKEVVRNVLPSVQDLVGTYAILQKNGTKFTTSIYANTWLQNLNIDINTGKLGKMHAVSGNGFKTDDVLKLSKRRLVDKILGLWEEGSLNVILKNDGDGTVVGDSSKISGVRLTNLNSKHRPIVDASIPTIGQYLGYTGPAFGSGNLDLKNKVIFFLGSPATMNVKCGNQTADSDEQGFVILDFSTTCDVKIKATGNGIYHLFAVSGRTPNKPHYFEDEIAIGKTKSFKYDFSTLEPKILLTKNSYEDAWKIISRKVEKMRVIFPGRDPLYNNMQSAIEGEDMDRLTRLLFVFRRGLKEEKISGEIIDLLVQLYSHKTTDYSRALSYYNQLVGDLNRVDRNGDMQFFGAKSFKLLEGYVDDAKNAMTSHNYGIVKAKYELGQFLAKEVWME